MQQTTDFMSQKATRWHYRAIKREICAGICFFLSGGGGIASSQTTLAVRGDRCFGAASNTSTVPSVDGLTWLTLINISKISDESPSGSGGQHMSLHPAFVSAIFLFTHCSFGFSLIRRCVVHEPAGPQANCVCS